MTFVHYLMLVLVLGLVACDRDQPTGGQQNQAPQVGVSTPLQAQVTEWDEYTGRFSAIQSVEVRARVSGYLESIHFSDGAFLEKGDLLFVIDPRPFEAALSRAKAEVERAESRVAFTTTEVARAEELVGRGNISQETYDQRVQEKRQAAAELDASKADLRNARLNLEFTQVRAPIDGRVSNHFVDVGNLISGGSTNATLLTRIVALDPIHFVFDASEQAYLRYLRLNERGERASSRDVATPVQVKLADEDSFRHEGRMDFVDNRVDPDTGTIRGRAIFANEDLFLTPGLFGRLRLRGRENYSALLLPDKAVLTDQSNRIVYVLGDDGVPQSRIVTLGPLYRGLRVIAGGVSADDRVIVDGLISVRPGAPVSPTSVDLALEPEA